MPQKESRPKSELTQQVYLRVPSLGVNPLFIESLANLVEQGIEGIKNMPLCPLGMNCGCR